MDERMRMDGRNPYGSEGGYVVSSRGRSRGGRRRGRDRAMMDYGNYDMARGGYRGGGRGQGGNRGSQDYGDYGYDMERNRDMRSMDYRRRPMNDMGEEEMRGDGHYMHGGRQGGYEPVEFMGYCSGYYGSPDQDYGRGRDYGNYGYRDYGRGYGDYGDYGETLT